MTNFLRLVEAIFATGHVHNFVKKDKKVDWPNFNQKSKTDYLLANCMLVKIVLKGAIECIDSIFLIVLWYLHSRYVA